MEVADEFADHAGAHPIRLLFLKLFSLLLACLLPSKSLKERRFFMEFGRTLTFWTAVACLCGGQLAAQETVEIRVTGTNGVSRIIQVNRGVPFIEPNFFRTPLLSITLPNGLTELQILRILSQPSLTNLTLPKELTKLEHLHLQGTGLTSLTLPEGLTNLEWMELYANNELTSLSLPEGLTSLERMTLLDNQLMSLTLPE